MPVETMSFGIELDASQLEATLRRLEERIEQSSKKMQGSIAGFADKLEQDFARVEIKLDILREDFQAIETHANQAGNAIGRVIELFGELSRSKRTAAAGKAIGMLSFTSEFEEKLAEFFANTPKNLLARFGTLERRAGSLKSEPDQARAAQDIAAIRGDQRIIINALELQANALQTKLANLIGTDPEVKAKSTPQILAEADLQAVLKVLREIKELTNNPVLKEQIEKSPVMDRSPERTGALEQRLTELSGLFDELIGKAETFGATLGRVLDEATQRGAGADGFKPSGFGPEGSRDGGRFLRASFDPADSPFGGAGLDGLNQNLADAGWRVQDLSAGFVELTEASGGYEARAAALNALFGEQSGLIGQLLTQVPELGGQFSAFLERTSQEADTLNQVVGAVGQSFLNAFEGAIQRGESLGDVLKGLIVDLAEIALRAAGNKFLELFLDSLFGASGPGPGAGPPIRFAQGAAFGPGGRFLSLGQGAALTNAMVKRPTAFRFARGVVLMGEAGPEAVLPLFALPPPPRSVETQNPIGAQLAPPIAGGPEGQASRSFRCADGRARSHEPSAVSTNGVQYVSLEHESFVYRESCAV